MSITLETCKQCPLWINNPIGTTPIAGAGLGDIMIINHSPPLDDILLGRPSTINFDLIKDVLKGTPFYYTNLTKCYGSAHKNHINICKNTWLNDEIKKINPKTVFLLGIIPAKALLGNKKLKDILGREFIIDNIRYVTNYHPNYVINRGKSIYETFKSIFISYI